MKTKTFIVPHDFTNVADIALEHAIATARPLGAKVNLLHVVSKAKEVSEAQGKLGEIVGKLNTDVLIETSVRLGNIFEDIGDFAAEHQAELIFMGTHGTHGWQHITGMNALKVITNSTVPFIIVQEKTAKETGYDDIIVPLDLNKETKQKLAHVANIAKYFNSQVHVVIPEESDEFLRHQVKANIQFAAKFLEERDIKFTTKVLDDASFDKKMLEHAEEIGADLIAIMNLNKNNLLGVITANHEEMILNNKSQIPTLIVNPIEGLNALAADFNG